MSIKTLGKLKRFFKDEETSNKTVFSIAVAVLIAVLGFGGLQLMVAGRDTGYGYGYGYDGTYGYGYQQYNPNPVAATQPNGRLVKESGSANIYVLLGGEKHWIPTPAIFWSHGYKWADVYTMDLTNYASGTDISFREGTLVKAAGADETYVIDESNGTFYKKHITIPTVFWALGYTWSQVYTAADLSGYTDGADITAATTQPDGRLVKATDSAATYVLENGTLRHIVSPQVFWSQGYAWANVYATDITGYAAGTDLNFREGTLVKETGSADTYVTDYLSDTYYKRHITSPTVFWNLGYTWSKVNSVTDLSSLAGGTDVN